MLIYRAVLNAYWERLAIFSFIAFVGCTRHIGNDKIRMPLQKINLHVSNADTTIIFLSFRITQTDSANDNFDITLINSKLATGILKKKSFKEAAVIEKGYLYYEFASDEQKTHRYEKIENPLERVYEFPGEEKQDLAKKIVVKKTGEFIIRFQYDPSLKHLNIYKPLPRLQQLKLVYSAKISP